jgi:hypothetical protein
VLVALERLVVEEHRVLFGEVLAEAWSPPAAYRWIRYEDPDPIGRLIAASERLDALWKAHPEATEARARFAAWEAERLRDLPTP